MIHLRTLICGVLACGAASGYANQTSENAASQSRGSDANKVVAKKDSPSEIAAKYTHLDDAEEGAATPETKQQTPEQIMHQKVQEQKAKQDKTPPLSAPEKKAANQKAAEQKALQEQRAQEQKMQEQKINEQKMQRAQEQKALQPPPAPRGPSSPRPPPPPPPPGPKRTAPRDWTHGT